MSFLMNPSLELIIFVLLVLSIIIFWLYRNNKRYSSATSFLQLEDGREPVSTPKKDYLVTEFFDYLGTKILHDKGKYIVNYKGKVITYDNWKDLPKQFQEMVVELDQRSVQQKKPQEDYFMEIINGSYYITTPNGKKKRYDRYNDIPPEVREVLKR
jgi:hypothetical protein